MPCRRHSRSGDRDAGLYVLRKTLPASRGQHCAVLSVEEIRCMNVLAALFRVDQRNGISGCRRDFAESAQVQPLSGR